MTDLARDLISGGLCVKVIGLEVFKARGGE